MQITERELELLNFYRASELHGGLILGQLARRTREPKLIRNLTAHSAEELVHAQLWTMTIYDLGGTPQPVRDTYQQRYASLVGAPTTMLEVLALTQVFERRVHRHFTAHLRRAGTHPRVRRTLRRMLEDEKDHLTWVKRWLDSQATNRADEVAEQLRRYAEADAAIYDRLLGEYHWKEAA